jgi:hypothetical protein
MLAKPEPGDAWNARASLSAESLLGSGQISALETSAPVKLESGLSSALFSPLDANIAFADVSLPTGAFDPFSSCEGECCLRVSQRDRMRERERI